MSAFADGFAQGVLAARLQDVLLQYGYTVTAPTSPDDQFEIKDEEGRTFTLDITFISETIDETDEPDTTTMMMRPVPPAS